MATNYFESCNIHTGFNRVNLDMSWWCNSYSSKVYVQVWLLPLISGVSVNVSVWRVCQETKFFGWLGLERLGFIIVFKKYKCIPTTKFTPTNDVWTLALCNVQCTIIIMFLVQKKIESAMVNGGKIVKNEDII